MRKLILLLTILNILNQRCLEGCLRCTDDNKCLYCDVLQNYNLEFGRCIKRQFPNCSKINEKGRCEMCEVDYYLDNVNFVCYKVHENLRVPQCKYHLRPGTCSVCEENFYQKNGGCFEISSPVSNCEMLNERGECLKCKEGYLRSIDRKNCIPRPDNQNCATFNNVDCRKCAPDYLRNENYYLNYIFRFQNANQIELLTQYFYNVKNKNSEGFNFKTCEKILVPNCLVFENAQRCKKCSLGFVITQDFQCEPIPQTTIANCIKYSSLTTCIDCAQGYFLSSSNVCGPVFPIENCLLYKTNATTSICTRCTDDYYLSAENLCTLRSPLSKIDFCEELSFNFEQCNKCKGRYIPTNDKLKCLPLIENCMIYEPSNAISSNLKCKTCRSGFYYNETDSVCIRGSVENCIIFKRTKNECEVCDSLYYLVGVECHLHERIKSCSSYSQENQDICQACDQHHFLFKVENFCLKVDTIQNCKKYASRVTCMECEEGYYLTNPAICELIPPEENCLKKENDQCLKCRESQILQNGKCMMPFEYLLEGCSENNINGMNSFNEVKCNKCAKNYIPLNYKNSFYCVEKSKTDELLRLNGTLDDDCLQLFVNETDNSKECLRCREGLVLDNGRCLPNCQDQENLTIYRQKISLHNLNGDDRMESVKIEKINACYATIPNCKYASLTSRQKFTNPDYACEECVSGYLPVINVGESSLSVTKFPKKNKENDIHMPVNLSPALKCRNSSDYNYFVGEVLQIDNKKYIDNCEYYYSIDKQTLGCFKCKHGFSGRIIPKIKNCLYYKNSLECSVCEQGFYLKSFSECLKVMDIINCVTYNQTASTTICEECSTDYFLNTNQCVIRNVSLRKFNATTSIDSDTFTCNQGYFIGNNECRILPEMCVGAILNGNNPQCVLCDHSLAYLNGVNCRLGTIQNCVQYDTNSHTCVKCDYNYYISDNKCVLNVYPPGMEINTLCRTFNQTTPLLCDECVNNSHPFEILNKCVLKVNNDPNCAEWEDEFRCLKCADNYYLNNLSRRCLEIPAILNCERMVVKDLDSNIRLNIDDQVQPNKYTHDCTKCKPMFHLTQVVKAVQKGGNNQNITVFECDDNLKVMREYCATSLVDGTVPPTPNVGCTSCIPNYFPIDFSSKYICVNKNYLAKKVNGFTPDSNCIRYKYEGGVYLCERCKYPRFMNETNNTCVSSCPVGTYKIIWRFENGVVKNNYCSATLPIAEITGCAEYIDSFSGEYAYNYNTAFENRNFELWCAKCQDDKVPGFDIRASRSTFIDIQKGTDEYQNVNDRFSLPNACYSADLGAGDRVHGLKNKVTRLIDNCELYIQLDPLGIYGCFKCKWGFTGRVNNFTASDTSVAGYIEYCEPMNGCDTNVRYGGTHFNTKFLELNGSINTYFSCHKCSNNKILVGFYSWDETTTESATILGLKAFKYNSDKATGTATSEDNISLEDYSNVLMCIDPAEFMNADAADANAMKLRVFDSLASNDFVFCGLRIVNTKNKGTLGSGSYQCLVCSPGYSAAYDDTTKLLGTCAAFDTTNCADPAVANMNLQTTFNGCSTCTFIYDDFLKTPDFHTCYNNIPNCLAGNLHFDNTSDTCFICRPGFELMLDNTNVGYCVPMNSPNCQLTQYKNNRLITNKKEFLMTNYFLRPQLNVEGCMSCSETDVQVLHKNDDNIDKLLCSKYNNLPPSIQFSTIPDCENIGWDQNHRIICKKCIPNFILEKDNYCADKTPYVLNLPNCIHTEDLNGSYCLKCQQSTISDVFLNIGGWCLPILSASVPTSDALPNCIEYDEINSRLYHKAACKTCTPGFYAKTSEPFDCQIIPVSDCAVFDSQCVKCNRGFGLINKLTDSGTTEKICIPLNKVNGLLRFDHDHDCKELEVENAPETMQNFKLKCKKCELGVLRPINQVQSPPIWCSRIVKETQNCNNYDLSQPLFINQSKLYCTGCPLDRYLDLNNRTCVAHTPIANCSVYELYVNRCKECQNGYEKNFLGLCYKTQPNELSTGYIQTCNLLTNCDASVIYEGLSAELNSIFSCHKCLNPNQIPIAAAEFDYKNNREGFFQMIGLGAFSYKGVTQNYKQVDASELVVQCMEINNTNLAVNDFSFPTNCGLALAKINHDSISTGSATSTNVLFIDKLAVTCAACKPGFAPTFAESAQIITSKVKYMVAACNIISNCQFSKWFNACTQCDPNYSFGYNPETGISFSECISYSQNPNCLSVETKGNVKICRFCKKGSYINNDGYCEVIKPNRCKYEEFKFAAFYKEFELNVVLHDYTRHNGCSECEEGFLALLATQDRHICTHSLYHSKNLLPVNTKYKINCLNYSVDKKGFLICTKCANNLVISEEGNCLPVTNLPNCKIACDANLCSICQDGFVLVNRICVAAAITNCLVYGNNRIRNDLNCNMDGLEKQVCIQCIPGFYLDSGICKTGEVPNCKFLETLYLCNECLEDFTLVQMNEGRSYCYPNDQELSCKRFNAKKFQSLVLDCDECVGDNYIKNESKTDFFEYSCMRFVNVENCVEYRNNPIAISNSAFECIRCSENSYLSQGACSMRLIQPQECSQFDEKADKCLECADGYFISENGNACTPYPQGLNGCKIYKTKTTCKQCDSGKYLKEDLCLVVEQTVSNCVDYEDDGICAVCANGYLVRHDGVCVKTIAKDCLVYDNINECQSCPQGFGLKREGEVLDCVQISLQNCVKFELEEPYECVQCEPLFYPNSEGVCEAVATEIKNCLSYSDKDRCEKCQRGSALSQDKQNCIFTPEVVAVLDRNCIDSAIPENPVCNTCNPGYRFSFGNCVACKTELIESGCGNCHPDFPEICLMCAQGWIQTPEGNCVRPIIESFGLHK